MTLMVVLAAVAAVMMTAEVSPARGARQLQPWRARCAARAAAAAAADLRKVAAVAASTALASARAAAGRAARRCRKRSAHRRAPCWGTTPRRRRAPQSAFFLFQPLPCSQRPPSNPSGHRVQQKRQHGRHGRCLGRRALTQGKECTGSARFSAVFEHKKTGQRNLGDQPP